MSLTPPLPLCTENITANMRGGGETGGREFDMEDVHNGLLWRVGEETFYLCQLYMHEYTRRAIYHIRTHVAVNGNRVRECVCLRAP